MSRDAIHRTSIPLPPLPEQRRIAAILDKADVVRRKRKEAIKLTESFPRAVFVDMFGDPVMNSKDWPQKPLTAACRLNSGGTPSKAVASNWIGNTPWFSPKDLKQDDLFDSIDHINSSVPEESNLHLFPKNTVVIVVRGMILAHTFPVSVLRVQATINQDLKALIPREDIEPQFLAWCLRVQGTHALAHVSTAAHGTKRLDVEGLKKIPVIMPPIKLQQAFASIVEDEDTIKQKMQASFTEMDNQFNALVQRCFG